MASAEKVPMLAEGHRKLSDQVKHLKMVERPEVVQAIEDARAHGDLSENAEYHAAKERQGQIEASIADIEDQLSRAIVIDPTTLSGDKVVFGATVTLADEEDRKRIVTLVGEDETDPSNGRISWSSPIGRAIRGAAVGDLRRVLLPAGERELEIVDIAYLENGG